MAYPELERFSAAITCLQQVLEEGNKSSNIKIDLMLENVYKCTIIVQELHESEQDAFFKTALSSLQASLSSYAAILTNKMQNLNQNRHSYTSVENTLECTTTLQTWTVSPKTSNITIKDPNDVGESDNFGRGNHSKSRQAIIQSTILPDSSAHFDDVIGLKEAKQSLYDAIIMPLMLPHLFSGGRQSWRRILLYGPPGTGKSHLAQALSAEVKATFYCVSSTDIMSSWVGESEKLIKELFNHANAQDGQVIIFIDEIDSLCRHRSSSEDEGSRRIKTELLIQMDGACQSASPKILLLCATNCPWDLDVAFLRRFQKRIYIPLPDQNDPVNLSDDEWMTLATQTEGYSGSDLSTLTMGALLQPVRDLQTANHWEITSDGKWRPSNNLKLSIKTKLTEIPAEKICTREVNLQDFLSCLQSHRPTVSRTELRRFEEFTSSYGQIG